MSKAQVFPTSGKLHSGSHPLCIGDTLVLVARRGDYRVVLLPESPGAVASPIADPPHHRAVELRQLATGLLPLFQAHFPLHLEPDGRNLERRPNTQPPLPHPSSPPLPARFEALGSPRIDAIESALSQPPTKNQRFFGKWSGGFEPARKGGKRACVRRGR